MKLPTWLRSVVGIGTGILNVYANGTGIKPLLVSISLAALGVVSHLSSTSDPTSPTGVKPGATKTSGPGWGSGSLPLLILALFLCVPHMVEAQTDNFIAAGSVSPYVTIGRGLIWGGNGLGTVGQNFIFHPIDANEGFCLFIFNNNPTNAHSVSVTVAQTGDPTIQSYQGQTARWTSVPTQTTFPVSVGASTLVGINYKTTASAGIVISFTGNATQAGSPDSADIFTVQTNQSACGSLATNSVQGPFLDGSTVTAQNRFPLLQGGLDSSNIARGAGIGLNGFGNANSQIFSPGSVNTNLFQKQSNTFNTVYGSTGGVSPAGVLFASFPMRLSGLGNLVPGDITDELRAHTPFNNSFYVSTSTTNPGAATSLLHIFCSACAVAITPVRLRIACNATTPTNCDFEILRTTAIGTTCTTPVGNNMFLGAAGAPGATLQTTCTGAPTTTGTSLFREFIASNQTAVIDMTGFMINTSTAQGILIRNTTAITTGTMNVSLEWAEE